jgi:Zn-dependent peptidase ImmA (M78 family)
MTTALHIKISPAVLTWARKSMGYSQEEAAHKGSLKEHQIREWEDGKGNPTYAQLETLAYNVYKRPLALFFRSTPPQEASIQQDFRNITNAEAEHLSTEMRLALRKAKHLQNLIGRLNADAASTPKFRQFQVSVQEKPEDAAMRFRDFIGLSIEEQKSWNAEQSFEQFKIKVEGIGIYVFQFGMPFQEARAFSLTDDYPVVVLNTADAKNGRIFSLFHEVCHILFNTGGIFKDKETARLKAEYTAIEDFCNRFAAAFLIPDDLFKEDISDRERRVQEWSEEDLERLAKLYSVSKEVVLRKLVDMRLASKDFLFAKKAGWDKAFQAFRDAQRAKHDVCAAPVVTVLFEDNCGVVFNQICNESLLGLVFQLQTVYQE